MVLNPHSTKPLYEQLADLLRAAIRASDPPLGERLPTEEELAAKHGVSRTTVRLALGCKAEGLLESAPGAWHDRPLSPAHAPAVHRAIRNPRIRKPWSRLPRPWTYRCRARPAAAQEVQEVLAVPAPEDIAQRLNLGKRVVYAVEDPHFRLANRHRLSYRIEATPGA